VRWLTTLCFVFLWMPTSWAQHQEPSLVDRLLRPNMELQNNAQGKKFSANSAVIERRGTVGTFSLKPKPEREIICGHTRAHHGEIPIAAVS
jgi:hypothetical protein